jgi:antitoxin VapB
MSKVSEERQEYLGRLDRVFGSMPWLKAKEVRTFRVKIFKSGNSLALRLPAELGLEAGMEMNLRVENGEHFTFEPIEPPKRKFDIGKVWGSASGLKLIEPQDRVFAERPLLWDRGEGESEAPEQK